MIGSYSIESCEDDEAGELDDGGRGPGYTFPARPCRWR